MRSKDFNPGDLIVFIHGAARVEESSKELGWIVRRDNSDPDDDAVMVSFTARRGEYHYYDVELYEWEKSGYIEVKRA